MLPIVIKILSVFNVVVSLLIILLVLMQRPKNEGLGAAFGGGMTDNLFGAQTTNVLQTITRWLGGMFFALTLILSILYVRQGVSRSAVQKELSKQSATPPKPASQVPLGPDGKPIPLEEGAAFSDTVKAPATEGDKPPTPPEDKDKKSESPAPPANPAAPDAKPADDKKPDAPAPDAKPTPELKPDDPADPAK